MSDERVLIPQATAHVMMRAEIDQQIATARAYPRDIKRAIANMATLATVSNEAAADCIFALPHGGKELVGPSIRFAEIIVSQWGNCRTFARVTEINRSLKYVEVEGVFLDLETNHANAAPIRRPIMRSNGAIHNDDMINMTTNAAAAIAKRNAVLGGIPRPIWGHAYDSAFKRVAGDIRNLDETRRKSIEAFAEWNVTPQMVCAALGVEKIDDIKHRSIVTLRGMFTAIKNEEATVEEVFGIVRRSEPKPAAASQPAKQDEPVAQEMVPKAAPDDDFPGDRAATASKPATRRGPPPPPARAPVKAAEAVEKPDNSAPETKAEPQVSSNGTGPVEADSKADTGSDDIDILLHDLKADITRARSDQAIMSLIDEHQGLINKLDQLRGRQLSDAVKLARAKFRRPAA